MGQESTQVRSAGISTIPDGAPAAKLAGQLGVLRVSEEVHQRGCLQQQVTAAHPIQCGFNKKAFTTPHT